LRLRNYGEEPAYLTSSIQNASVLLNQTTINAGNYYIQQDVHLLEFSTPFKINRREWNQSKQDYKGTVLYFITIYPPILNTMVECFTVN
jgi:hypothetical protein